MRVTERLRRLSLYAALAALLLATGCASAPLAKETSLTDLVVAGDINAIKKFYANQEQLNRGMPKDFIPCTTRCSAAIRR
jgi:hypothetical protein